VTVTGGQPAETPSYGASTLATITRTSTLSSAPLPSGHSCPVGLSGEYQFPHLIIPVDKANPDKAYGTSYNGIFSSTVSSLFNFDIPYSYAGKTCSLVFLFPTKDQLETSNYDLSGNGGIKVSLHETAATESTTYNSIPGPVAEVGATDIQPGNEYLIASGPCAAGGRVGYEVEATGSLDLNYFQDYNPSPLGLYITVC